MQVMVTRREPQASGFLQKPLPRVAMIASYEANCGMATYTKYLLTAMRPLISELKVFAEFVEEPTENPEVVRCWDRHKGIYQTIIPEVVKFAPDIVYIQHEYGSMNNPVQWNLLVGHLSSLFRTVVVLHSVYDHVDKLVFEAPCNEIIVHSKPGRDLLIKKGIEVPIHHIPHGCIPPIDIDLKFSNMQNKQLIFQYGFGFEYKGWTNVNDIIDGLKNEFPDVAYVGIFNMSKFSLMMHSEYYKSLMRNIRDRHLEEHIVLHKGFRSEQVLFSYMKQARINLFPYWNHPEWRVYGASGAVRLALASGTPTIVGDVPFFEEFKGYIPVCSTTEEYVKEMAKILKDVTYREETQKGMLDFINERSWDKVARWYLDCTEDKSFTAPIPERAP